MIQLLAQTAARLPQQSLKGLQDRFAQPDPMAPTRIVMVLCLLAFGVLLVWLLGCLQERRQQPAKPQPMRLYLRLQRKLRLPLRDIFYLWYLAYTTKIENPTAILISSGFYDDAVARFNKTGSIFSSGSGTTSPFNTIRKRLFPDTPS